MLQPDRFWADLCRHLERPDMVTDPRFESGMARFQNREACVAELDAVFGSRTLDEWRTKLADVEGVWAPMQTAKEVGRDPQVLRERLPLPRSIAATGRRSRWWRAGAVRRDDADAPARPRHGTAHRRGAPGDRLHVGGLAALKEAGAIS
jgi:crotonobetainyl-CoA:carnitine CoA-transferase CaiB-like acyl-CoA transferase